MTRISNIAIISFFILLAGTVGIGSVEAGKSIKSNVSGIPVLYYFWNGAPIYTGNSVPADPAPDCGGSGACGLIWGLYEGAVADITYKAQLINIVTGNQITDAASVPVGTRFRIERDTSTLNTDIWWVGTGWSSDSPYGRWVNNAGPLSLGCLDADKVGSNTTGRGSIRVDSYVLLNVAPVTPTITGASSNISCDSSNVCTVNSPGAVRVGLQFPTTIGKFYYRYYARSGGAGIQGCHANNVVMRTAGTVASCSNTSCWNNPSHPEYVANFPAKTITFNLTGTAANRPPANPTITPNPHSGLTNISYPFTITGTDPDNDQIRYQVDINNNLSPDLNLPSTGFINSGTAQIYNRTFATPGTYIINVRSEDSKGAVSSGWGQTTVTITAPRTPTVATNPATLITPTTATFNGTVNPNGSPATGWFRYSMTNPGTCNDTFGTRLPASGGTNLGGGTSVVAFNQSVTGLSAHTTYYFCAIGSNTNGTGFGTVLPMNTANSLPTAVITTPGGPLTIPEGTPVTFVGEGTDPDGDPITTYEWDTTCTIGGGSLSGSNTFDLATLAPGTHTVYLMVQDNQTGGWSTNCPHVEITVTPVSGPSCPQTTISNCELPVTSPGSSAGSCSAGYTGTCSYPCATDGTWDVSGGTNSCVVLPPVVVTDFKVCDPGAVNCVTSGTKTVNAGDPLEIHWDSENATICTALSGTGFQTGNAVRGTDPAFATPVLDTTEQYSVACRRNNEPFVVKTITVRTRGAGPSLIARPRTVKEGDLTELTWDTNTNIETACSLTGGSVNLPTLPSDGDPKAGSVSTPVLARTTYTLSCPNTTDPTAPPLTDTATVDVISRGFET